MVIFIDNNKVMNEHIQQLYGCSSTEIYGIRQKLETFLRALGEHFKIDMVTKEGNIRITVDDIHQVRRIIHYKYDEAREASRTAYDLFGYSPTPDPSEPAFTKSSADFLLKLLYIVNPGLFSNMVLDIEAISARVNYHTIKDDRFPHKRDDPLADIQLKIIPIIFSSDPLDFLGVPYMMSSNNWLAETYVAIPRYYMNRIPEEFLVPPKLEAILETGGNKTLLKELSHAFELLGTRINKLIMDRDNPKKLLLLDVDFPSEHKTQISQIMKDAGFKTLSSAWEDANFLSENSEPKLKLLTEKLQALGCTNILSGPRY